jgi:DNA-binding CsgD family transcriptional regulator
MSKSNRLRHRDLRNIYRLIGECRDLGADPLAWRRRLLEGVMQLTGARVGYLVELLGFPGPGRRAGGKIQLGLEASRQTKLFAEHFEFMAQGGEDPMLRHFGALPLDRQHTFSTDQVLDLDQWRRSESFQMFHRRMDMDPGILSMCPLRSLGPQHHHTLSLRRCLHERSFSLRDVRLVDCLHHELASDVGRHLAAGHEPSASTLPPRLRQTLEGLLEGLSEKQLADRLGISRATVHEYVTALYRRFGVSGRAELMARWIRYGRGAAAN